jgi:hypothetical protein
MFHDSSAGSLTNFDHGVATARHWDVLQIPIEERSVKRFCFADIRGVQFHVHEGICHFVSPLELNLIRKYLRKAFPCPDENSNDLLPMLPGKIRRFPLILGRFSQLAGFHLLDKRFEQLEIDKYFHRYCCRANFGWADGAEVEHVAKSYI